MILTKQQKLGKIENFLANNKDFGKNEYPWLKMNTRPLNPSAAIEVEIGPPLLCQSAKSHHGVHVLRSRSQIIRACREARQELSFATAGVRGQRGGGHGSGSWWDSQRQWGSDGREGEREWVRVVTGVETVHTSKWGVSLPCFSTRVKACRFYDNNSIETAGSAVPLRKCPTLL
jgi:hypothetical protein